MDKHLTVYPIASGDMLNIFADNDFGEIRIMDMAGNMVYHDINTIGSKSQVNIKELESATYIIEIVYANQKTARSVFVKT
ncbi:MAG: T9SS type A sorting domain-containing protein [Chitinophagales bacterium]|nr:T9SS type A sorting domain-containing protein [Chitinophagales bacterium]